MNMPQNSPLLVGRSEEIDHLRALLKRAEHAHGQVFLITGEAGIGKTRLLASLAQLAMQNGFKVVRGECVEQDQDFPYAPIVDGLRSHFSTASSEDVRRMVSPFHSDIVRLLPELALRLETQPAHAALEPEAEKHRLFEVLVQIYQQLAATGLLLIFEDVYWSDATSLEFFRTLTRRIRSLPILVALSSRLPALDSEIARLQLYFDRADNARTISLNPLTDMEIEQLTKSLLQTTNPMHPVLLENLKTLVQGNPLYTEQIVHILRQSRQINLVNGTWIATSTTSHVEIPTTIVQTIGQQMARLNESAKHVVQLAAVIGRQFELNVLMQLTTFDEATLTGLLKELIGNRILNEVSQDRFSFRHALLRQTVYDSLLIRERQVLHQTILYILEKSVLEQPDSRLAELAHHAHQAQAWSSALQYGLQAGQHALSLHAPRAAVEHFSRAIEAAQQLEDSIFLDLLLMRGAAYDILGEFQSALDDYESALKLAEQYGDHSTIWNTLIAVALLWASRDYNQVRVYCERALKVAEAIKDSRLIGHSLNRLGNWYLNTGQSYTALDYHKRALAVFEELNDLAGKGETLDLLGMTSGHVLHLNDQLTYYQQAVEIFRELDDQKALASTLANLAQCINDFRYAEEAGDIARQVRWYSGEVYAYNIASYTHSLYGHFAESLSYLQRGLELVQVIDHKQWHAALRIFSGFVYRDLLELDTAASEVAHGIELARSVGSHWFVVMGCGLLAQIRIRQGLFDAAAELLAEHPVPDPRPMQYVMKMLAEAELALARGDVERALSSNERLRQVVLLDQESVPLSTFGGVPYLVIQARAVTLLNRHDDALDLLQRARRICEDARFIPALWWVEVAAIQVARHHDPEMAQDAIGRARACTRKMAENIPEDLRTRFVQRAEKQIASAQTPPQRSHQKPAEVIASQSQLTRREIDVVREVALGKTNQQIADDLHITVKTVETHLTRILSKLNMTSRTQVALWAAENNLTSHPE